MKNVRVICLSKPHYRIVWTGLLSFIVGNGTIVAAPADQQMDVSKASAPFVFKAWPESPIHMPDFPVAIFPALPGGPEVDPLKRVLTEPSEIRGVLLYAPQTARPEDTAAMTYLAMKGFGVEGKVEESKADDKATSVVAYPAWSQASKIFYPQFSADGRRVLFHVGDPPGFRYAQYSLYMWDTLTKEVRYVMGSLAYPVIRWSPDGRCIAYITGGNLFGTDEDDLGMPTLRVHNLQNHQDKMLAQGRVVFRFTWTKNNTLLYSNFLKTPEKDIKPTTNKPTHGKPTSNKAVPSPQTKPNQKANPQKVAPSKAAPPKVIAPKAAPPKLTAPQSVPLAPPRGRGIVEPAVYEYFPDSQTSKLRLDAGQDAVASPDGRWLAYNARLTLPEKKDLVPYLYDSLKKQRYRIAGHKADEFTWTPDGRQLLLARYSYKPGPNKQGLGEAQIVRVDMDVVESMVKNIGQGVAQNNAPKPSNSPSSSSSIPTQQIQDIEPQDVVVLKAYDYQFLSNTPTSYIFEIMKVTNDGKFLLVDVSEATKEALLKRTLQAIDLRSNQVTIIAEFMSKDGSTIGWSWHDMS